MTEQTLEFTPSMLKEFKSLYEDVKDDPDAVFTFHGHQFVSGYAKHLIEYLTPIMEAAADVS